MAGEEGVLQQGVALIQARIKSYLFRASFFKLSQQWKKSTGRKVQRKIAGYHFSGADKRFGSTSHGMIVFTAGK